MASKSDSFHKKEYNITDCVAKLFTCGTANTLLILDDERVNIVDKSCCGTSTTSVNYGEVGDITKNKACCGCVGIGTSLRPAGISPGCGCDEVLVDSILADLNARLLVKGDIATRNKAADLGVKVDELTMKVDALLKHFNIKVDFTVAPENERMNR